MNKLIKPAKKALANKYGYRNVSVKNGNGTAWGWVEIKINNQSKPELCERCKSIKENSPFPLFGNDYMCHECREKQSYIRKEAQNIIHKAWQEAGLKVYTYCVDDGYNSESEEVLIDVNYI